MKHVFALLAIASTAWAYSPAALADEASTDSIVAPGPGHGGPGGPGFGGPGHGGPGGPGWGGPGHGGPGGPGWGGPGHGGPGGPGWGGPGPGWRPGHGPGRPGWNPGWGNGNWGRPGFWRPPHRPGWRPPMWRPLPPPPPSMPNYLCFGNFVGAFGSDRDAYIQLESRSNYLVAGTLDIEGPNAVYRVTGTCEQVGDVADIEIRLNGGQPYVGQIYRANDGQVYWEASQPGTGIRFALQRQ